MLSTTESGVLLHPQVSTIPRSFSEQNDDKIMEATGQLIVKMFNGDEKRSFCTMKPTGKENVPSGEQQPKGTAYEVKNGLVSDDHIVKFQKDLEDIKTPCTTVGIKGKNGLVSGAHKIRFQEDLESSKTPSTTYSNKGKNGLVSNGHMFRFHEDPEDNKAPSTADSKSGKKGLVSKSPMFRFQEDLENNKTPSTIDSNKGKNGLVSDDQKVKNRKEKSKPSPRKSNNKLRIRLILVPCDATAEYLPASIFNPRCRQIKMRDILNFNNPPSTFLLSTPVELSLGPYMMMPLRQSRLDDTEAIYQKILDAGKEGTEVDISFLFDSL